MEPWAAGNLEWVGIGESVLLPEMTAFPVILRFPSTKESLFYEKKARSIKCKRANYRRQGKVVSIVKLYAFHSAHGSGGGDKGTGGASLSQKILSFCGGCC